MRTSTTATFLDQAEADALKLIRKMENYEIKETTRAMLQSNLTYTTQVVKIGIIKSEPEPIEIS